MKFPRTLTVRDPEQVQALRGLLAQAPAFASYVHFGADNAPVRYELYASAKPESSEHPIAAFDYLGDELVQDPAIVPPPAAKKGKQ